MVKIGYWDCRGLSHPIRLLLEYKGVAYEWDPLPRGPAPAYDKTYFRSNKYKLLDGFDFPQLPYYQDESVKLTHSMAIMAYLGRKYDLGPRTDQEAMDLDLFREELMDQIAKRITGLCYPPSLSQDVKDEFVRESVEKLKEIEGKMARAGGPWLIGERITYVDFLMYEVMDHFRLLFPAMLDGFPGIQKFMGDFEALPGIKKYMESGRFKKYPLWSMKAARGNDGPIE